MLSVIIAEAALELIPKDIHHDNSVQNHCKKFGKKPDEMLLDKSWHFSAMKGIGNEFKRGRPDLVHFSLMSVCTIPLYWEKKISIYIHTIDDKVIFVGDNVHLPKSYHRFEGLVTQLFRERTIYHEGKKLLEIKDMDFDELIETIKPENLIGLSTQGVDCSCEKLVQKLTGNRCIVIGGFQSGHFSDKIKNKCNQLIKIDNRSLESHVVLGRILYEYEKTIFI